MMPRKSAASLAVVSLDKHRPRIGPPAGLSKAEKILFERLVTEASPSHFTAYDAPLLTAYVQAIILGRWAFKAAMDDPTALPTWERCCKTMATLATKLRLCPHSRSDPKTIARRSASYSPSAYDLMREED
jgi:hypothetical protein